MESTKSNYFMIILMLYVLFNSHYLTSTQWSFREATGHVIILSLSGSNGMCPCVISGLNLSQCILQPNNKKANLIF